eukprot:scaffold255_cov142-Skeletonema_menzelii.AAC.28
MVPEGGLGWNYNFQGVKRRKSMEYTVKLDAPERFYADCHREEGDGGDADADADFEDFLTSIASNLFN